MEGDAYCLGHLLADVVADRGGEVHWSRTAVNVGRPEDRRRHLVSDRPECIGDHLERYRIDLDRGRLFGIDESVFVLSTATPSLENQHVRC